MLNCAATDLDTAAEVVKEITYQPPPLPRLFASTGPRLAQEDDYIKWFYDRSLSSDATHFMEIHLGKELSNPHSRAKKQARWQARQVYKQELIQEYIRKELKEAASRDQTNAEARAEATWKWQRAIDEEEKARKSRRWESPALLARSLRKKARKAKREAKHRRRLTEMVLRNGRNQVIPSTQELTLV
jgi:hypothetical protein